jgi:hypothetical protein
VAQAITELGKSATGLPSLRSALVELTKPKPNQPFDPMRVAAVLRKFRGRVVGGQAIVQSAKANSKRGPLWAVRAVSQGGGLGGVVGGSSPPSICLAAGRACVGLELPPTSPHYPPPSDPDLSGNGREPGEEG